MHQDEVSLLSREPPPPNLETRAAQPQAAPPRSFADGLQLAPAEGEPHFGPPHCQRKIDKNLVVDCTYSQNGCSSLRPPRHVATLTSIRQGGATVSSFVMWNHPLSCAERGCCPDPVRLQVQVCLCSGLP